MNKKSIEVSEEMYDALMSLSREINQQDHRGTAMPYFFQVQEKQRINGVQESDDFEWMTEDGETFDDDIISIVRQLEEDNHDIPEHINEVGREMSSFLLDKGYRKNYFRMTNKYSNAFFTAKACKEHIEANEYHYVEPVDYLSYASRNKELELVYKFLCELTGGSIYK